MHTGQAELAPLQLLEEVDELVTLVAFESRAEPQLVVDRDLRLRAPAPSLPSW